MLTRYMKPAVSWIDENRLACALALVVLIQTPLTLWLLCSRPLSSTSASPAIREVPRTTRKPQAGLAPFLPSRPDPFVPLPGMQTAENPPSATHDDLPPIAKAIAEGPRRLPPLTVFGGSALPKPPTEHVMGTREPPADAQPKARLQGVVRCGASRLAVIEVAPGGVSFVKRSDMVPGLNLLVNDILEDGVTVSPSSGKPRRPRKVLIGKDISEL